MKKNIAGQFIGAQLVSKTDGSAVTTGTTTIYVTGDAGTQAVGSVGAGACTHEGNGYWTYAPAQAETNYNLVAFTVVNAAACNVTVQVETSYPQTGDSFTTLGAGGAGLTALGDARIANLDAAVSTRSTYAGGAVASVTADVGITQAGADKVWGSAARSLTTFGTLVADIATAVWGAVTRTLTAGTNIALAKGTGVTGLNDIAAGTAMTLAGAYDAAKTAATQASVNAIPTAPLLAANYTAPDNASIATILGQTGTTGVVVTGIVDADVKKINGTTVNGTTVNGTGAAGDLWRG